MSFYFEDEGEGVVIVHASIDPDLDLVKFKVDLAGLGACEEIGPIVVIVLTISAAAAVASEEEEEEEAGGEEADDDESGG